MKKIRAALVILLLAAPLAAGSWQHMPAPTSSYSPLDTGTNKAWYDASTSDAANMTLVSTKISVLKDKSGNGYDLSNGTDASRPTYSANSRNGLGTIACSRTASTQVSLATTQLVSTGSDHTITIVAKVDSYGVNHAAMAAIGSNADVIFLIHKVGNTFAGGSSSGWNFGVKSNTGPGDDFNWHYYTWTYDGTGATTLGHYTMYVDGVAQTVASADTTTWNLGAVQTAVCGYGPYTDPVNFLTGNLGEFIIDSVKLSGAQLTAQFAYITTKWGF